MRVPLSPQAVDLTETLSMPPFSLLSYSKALTNIHRPPVVEPWLARDMEKQQFADVEALIGAFLSKAMKHPRNRKMNVDTFHECRDTISFVWSDEKIGSPIVDSLKK